VMRVVRRLTARNAPVVVSFEDGGAKI